MKKGMFLLLSLAICLSACSKEEQTEYEKDPQAFGKSKYNDMPSLFQEGKMDVKIKIDKASYDVNTNKISYNIINNGEDFLFGHPYEIEQIKNGSWRKIPFKLNTTFTSIGIILPKGKTVKKTINFDSLNIKLKPGYYRVIDHVYLDQDKKKDANLSAIFQII